MKIYSKIIIDMESGNTLYEDSFDYQGRIALCKKSSGGDGDQVITQRYAKYIESHHSTFLDLVATHRDAVISDSPYVDYEDIDIEVAFFGAGYTISSFPSLYDMYGKFMAGLDVCALYAQIFEDTIESPEVHRLVSTEAALLDDDIEANVLPRFQTGMRDINSVMSSSYVIGKSLIEDARVKAIEKFSAELKYRLIPIVSDRWKTHLEWNRNVIMTYAEIMKLYYSARIDTDDFNYSMSAKDKLWPFTVLEYDRAALGALQGATTVTSDVAGASQIQKAIGGALSGAGMGAMMFPANPVVGAGVGALLGLGSSFL
ncbi:glycine zipper family protein [candidate division WOR-3 bacterium]|nr:glycine zipper family protein [candidate division WOR-3 bacterium]